MTHGTVAVYQRSPGAPGADMDKDYLTLKRAPTGASGEDYDVLCGGEVVGRIFLHKRGSGCGRPAIMKVARQPTATRRHGRRHCRRRRERGVRTRAATARLRDCAEFRGRSLLGVDRLASC